MNKVFKRRQLLSLILLLIYIINSLSSVMVFAESNNVSSPAEDFTIKDGILTSYKGGGGDVVIPKNVSVIEEGVFRDKNINSVKLPNSLVEIKDFAFSTNNISELIIPENVRTISSYAFSNNDITKLVLNKNDIKLGVGVFADNKLKSVNLEQITSIPKDAFLNNGLEQVRLSSNLINIEERAFAINKLSEVNIDSTKKDINVSDNAFIQNGQMVKIKTSNNNVKNSNIKDNGFGHIVNPININVKYLKEVSEGKYVELMKPKKIEFNPIDIRTIFSLNKESLYIPEDVYNHAVVNKNITEDGYIRFIPKKDNYELSVIYKELPGPKITFNENKVQEIQENKIEGDYLSREDLLSLIKATNRNGEDITDKVVITPSTIDYLEDRSYSIKYLVSDNNQAYEAVKTLIISKNPLLSKIGSTEWIYGDFIYDGPYVIGFSESGELKLKNNSISKIGIPGVNPHTGEAITNIYLSKKVGDEVLYSFRERNHIKEIEFDNPSAVKLIGEGSFAFSRFKELPAFPNLEILEDEAFYSSTIGGKIEMPKIRSIGEKVFLAVRDEKNPFMIVDKVWPDLTYIGSHAFDRIYLGRYSEDHNLLPEMPNVIEVGEYAIGSHAEYDGKFPVFESLKSLSKGFFRNGGNRKGVDMTESFPNLEYISESSFSALVLAKGFPKFDKVKEIGSFGLDTIRVAPVKGEAIKYPEFKSLEYAYNNAAFATGLPGPLLYLENLKFWGTQGLPNSPILLEEYPSLEVLGAQIWSSGRVNTNLVPRLPKLKHIHREALKNTSLKGVFGENEFGNWPDLETLDEFALASSNISGKLPYFPNLKEIKGDVFSGAKIDISEPFLVNSDIKIDKNTFRGVAGINNSPIVIKTIDGKQALNIEPSIYHVVNPKTIVYVGLDEDGNEILRKSVLASEVGENIVVGNEDVVGYEILSDDNFNSIPIKEIKDNTVYINYKKKIDNIISGDKYNIGIRSSKEPLNPDELSSFDITFEAMSGFQAVSEEIYYLVEYDPNVVRDIKFPSDFNPTILSPGKIQLRKMSHPNSSYTIPINYEVKGGFVGDASANFRVSIINSKDSAEYVASLSRPINPVKPFYQSLFTDTKTKKSLMSKTVRDINSYSFEETISIQPEIKNLIRVFNKVSMKYKGVEYDSIDGKKIADISEKSKRDGWTYNEVSKEYVYEKASDLYYDIEKMPIPELELVLDSPKSQQLKILSETDLDIETENVQDKHIRLKDENILDINVEERSGNVIYTNIDTPRNQKGSRFSYFYEGEVDRRKEFIWNLEYNILDDIDKLEIDIELPKEHNLTKIEFPEVNENEVVGEIYFIESDGSLGQKSLLRGSSLFNPFYYGYKNAKVIITNKKLLDNGVIKMDNKTIFDNNYVPKFDYLNNEENYYSQGYKVVSYKDDKEVLSISDSTYSELREANRTVFASIRDFSDSKSIIDGDGGTILYGIGSHDYIKTNINELEYDILIDSNHTVESVGSVIPNKGYFSYDVYENYNNSGKTLIKTKFKDLSLEIDDASEDRSNVIPLISVKLSNNDLDSTKLETYAMIKESKYHDIYYRGDGELEGIDLSKYSVDRKEANISIPEYFHINKKIKYNGIEKEAIVTKGGEEFSYIFNIYNKEKVEKEDFILVDVLPFKGDFNNSNNSNTIDVQRLKNIELPEGFNIEYFDTPVSQINKDTLIEDYRDKKGVSIPDENVTVIKITADKIGNRGKLGIEIPMISSAAEEKELITVNKFAYHHSELSYDQGFSFPVEQRVEALPKLRDVQFKKLGSENDLITGPLEGAEFILIDKDSEILGKSVSNKDGLVIFKDININQVDKIIETVAPEGYDKLSPIDFNNMEFEEKDGVYYGKDIVNSRKVDRKIFFKAVEVDNVDTLDYRDIEKERGSIVSKALNGVSLKLTPLDGDKEVVSLDRFLDFTKEKKLPYGEYKVEFDSYKGNNIEYVFDINENIYYIKVSENGLYYSPTDEFNEDDLMLMDRDFFYFPINKLPNVYSDDFIKIVKTDEDGNRLPGAVFEVELNYFGPPGTEPSGIVSSEYTTDANGEILIKKENSYITSIKAKELKAPNGYYISNTDYIDIPSNSSISYLEVKNNKMQLKVNKYKVIANNVSLEEAEELRDGFATTDNGVIKIEKNASGYYQVKEVWQDNLIEIVNGDKYATGSTNRDGSLIGAENLLGGINIEEDITVIDKTDISSHYRAPSKTISPKDYIIREDFDGIIEIDIEVLPRYGSVYVSKYVLSKLNTPTKGDAVNGTKFALLEEVDGSFKIIEEKTIENGSFVIFKNLNSEKNYRVQEIEASEGYEISDNSLRDVVINSNNSYIDRIIFKNYAENEVGSLNIKKVDGRTNKGLEGVEFTIFNSDGDIVESRYTNKEGEIEFLDLLLDEADFIIKETKAAPGYRISSEEIVASIEDVMNEKTFIVKNYKYNETPKTGTSGKLPYFLLSIPLIVLAYIFNKKKY